VPEYRYPTGALAADYARAGTGFAATAGPLALVQAGRTVTAVLVALAVIFVVYALRTAYRGATRVWVDDEAIEALGWRRTRLPWREITGMRLNYYSTKRDGRAGWMLLTLTGAGGVIRLESSLDGFVDIARRGYAAARRSGLALTPATGANLHLLGVSVPEAT